jgi:hypothetical protein
MEPFLSVLFYSGILGVSYCVVMPFGIDCVYSRHPVQLGFKIYLLNRVQLRRSYVFIEYEKPR